MNHTIYVSSSTAWIIPVAIVGVFGVIVLAVMFVKKHFKVFQDKEQPKSDKEIAKEELDRILEPVDEMVEKKQENDQTK